METTDSLGEFSNISMSYDVYGAERVNQKRAKGLRLQCTPNSRTLYFRLGISNLVFVRGWGELAAKTLAAIS